MSAGKFLHLLAISLICIVVFVSCAIASEQPLQEKSYVEDEIIVKFKKSAAEFLKKELSVKNKIRDRLPASLDNINRRYNVESIEPVFKNFKAARNRIEALKSKRAETLTEQERKLQRRLTRAPKNGKIPDLDRIYKVKLGKGMSAEQAISDYGKDPDVEYAQYNYIYSFYLESNDPCYPLQWALSNVGQWYPWDGRFNEPPGIEDADMDANEAWDLHTGVGGYDIVVGLIDTGVDYNHRDIIGNIWVNPGETAGNDIDDDENGYIDDIYGYDISDDDSNPSDFMGHGTHCAGIIAARGDNQTDITGICWQSKIMIVKVGPNITSDVLAEGILYAAYNGADVLSNSWGARADFDPTISAAIDNAHALGCVIVFAAGNGFSDVVYYTPANLPNTIAVVASNSNDEKPAFSNYGELADLAAPGVDILSLRASGISANCPYGDYLMVASGTSMACPYVSGACALMLSYNPTLSNQEVREVLNETVDVIFDPNDNICSSNGRLNVYSALSAIHPSKAHIVLDSTHYSCSDEIYIRLGDYDLQGSDSNTVTVTCGDDSETVTLYEEEPAIGVFTGNLYTNSDEPNQEDGILQVSHGQTITVTYYDANDGTGNPAWLNETATVDCVYPIVYDINFSDIVIGSRQTITVETDEPTTVRIECGTSCGESDVAVVEDNTPQPSHTLTFRIPNPQGDGTIYYFRAEIADRADNTILDPNDSSCYQFTQQYITVPTDYNTINEAAEVAEDGDVVLILPGTYYESLDMDDHMDDEGLPKQIKIFGSEPSDWDVVEATVVNGNGASNTIKLSYGTNSVLKGLTITGGTQGVFASTSVVRNCIITGNSSDGIKFSSGNGTLKNCVVRNNNDSGILVEYGSHTIKDSLFYDNNTGIEVSESCSAAITNCTITENTSYGVIKAAQTNSASIKNCIICENNDGNDLVDFSATYSWLSTDGDPCFVPDDDFYHLLPDSPCVDAGDPNGDYDGQTDIDGDPRTMGDNDVVDMGSDEVRRVYNEDKQIWYDTINEAAEDANDCDTIVLYPGIYNESLDMDDYKLPPYNYPKCIKIFGTEPNDWDIVEATVVDGNGASNTIKLSYGTNSVLKGITITGGTRGVYAGVSIVKNCIITGNSGDGVKFSAGNGTLKNCVIKNNTDSGVFVEYGAHTIENSLFYGNDNGINVNQSCNADITNCTITENDCHGVIKTSPYGSASIKNCILWDNTDDLDGFSATYSCISDINDIGDPNTTHNINDDPCFINGDEFYHLEIGSPCIDTGDAGDEGETDIDNAIRVFGTEVDMGSDETTYPDAHWWKLDEQSGTAAYDSIDSDDGAFSGSDPCWVNGIFGGAIDCNGVSDYFSVSTLDNEYSVNDTFTVAGWFKTDVSTGEKTIVGQWSQEEYEIYPDNYVDFYYGWQVMVKGKKVRARFGAYSTVYDMTTATEVNDGSWHHFALVYPSYPSDVSLYIDGELGATPNDMYFGAGDTKFRIGDASYVSSGEPVIKGGPFNGAIDDIMVFDRVLTADEVEQLYKNGQNPNFTE